jgi:hypothetical protein
MEEEITPAVVACGSEYTASITRRGQLLTWGLGSRGELGHDLPHQGEVSSLLPAQWAACSPVLSRVCNEHAGRFRYIPARAT